MKKITLTQGQYAFVDNSDFEELSKYKWFAHKKDSQFYAVRTSKRIHGKQNGIKMHRQILDVLEDNVQIDHINNNTLDNRRCNLRLCTNLQNAFNRKAHRNSSSKYKGVHWRKDVKKWVAQIMHLGKKIYIGQFNNEVEAAKAYDKKARELFGNFAYLNFSEVG